jgi:tRNA(Ile)-lysidine synthase
MVGRSPTHSAVPADEWPAVSACMSRKDPTGLTRRFALHLDRSSLLAGDGRVVIALSGGLDSVCLLHLLRFGVPGFEVHAAHFDHAMREHSAADATWVQGLCRAWDVPLSVARALHPPRGEAAARQLRYAFLHGVLNDSGADALLTAHHADDQAETVLFRMIRGTGLPGLAGIPASRGRLRRPLLPFARSELERFAVAAGLRWREDTSNLDLRYARNRIRHVVLPALEAVRPGAARAVARLAGRVAEAESGWRQVVMDAVHAVVIARDDTGFALARDRLLAYHPHIRARALRHLLYELGSRPDRSGTRSVMEFISSGRSGGRLDLAGGVRLEREFDRLLLRTAAAASTRADTALSITAAATGTGSCSAGGKTFVVSWTMERARNTPAHHAAFDPSRLRFPLELRTWRPGERIRLPYGSKKLKKLLRERHVGRSARSGVLVLCDADGQVLWVVGHARADTALPRPGVSNFTITVVDAESF